MNIIIFKYCTYSFTRKQIDNYVKIYDLKFNYIYGHEIRKEHFDKLFINYFDKFHNCCCYSWSRRNPYDHIIHYFIDFYNNKFDLITYCYYYNTINYIYSPDEIYYMKNNNIFDKMIKLIFQ